MPGLGRIARRPAISPGPPPPRFAGEGLSFRRAGAADADALAELRIEFIRIVKDGGIPGEDGLRAELSERFAADLASGRMVSWICLDGVAAVAASGVAFARDEEDRAELGLGAGEALVFNMYCAPAYRRRGIATELLDRCVAEARARGAGALRLQPTDDSRGIYERAGFRAEGEGNMLLDLSAGSRL